MSGSLTTGYFLREESVNATARGPHLSTVQYNTPSKRARTPPPPTCERLFISKERPRSPLTARIERPLLYRGGSASKKGTWPLLPHPSEAARCTSTGSRLACLTSPPCKTVAFPPATSQHRGDLPCCTSTQYDIIIGTGPGGGTLRYKLAPSGKNIPLLE